LLRRLRDGTRLPRSSRTASDSVATRPSPAAVWYAHRSAAAEWDSRLLPRRAGGRCGGMVPPSLAGAAVGYPVPPRGGMVPGCGGMVCPGVAHRSAHNRCGGMVPNCGGMGRFLRRSGHPLAAIWAAPCGGMGAHTLYTCNLPITFQ
jgi:hypothetical protein